ncbi:MAG: hypothetical protein ACTIDO_08430 [Brevibacterium aurantiacum]|uniref:hypothetical protein n=1 Tax=Brevibacterium aurantiacum TaxID=273384 RepID=UPI003F91CBEF
MVTVVELSSAGVPKKSELPATLGRSDAEALAWAIRRTAKGGKNTALPAASGVDVTACPALPGLLLR